jgi:hypothetical protein
VPTTRGRLVQINQVVIDQADYFDFDGYTRVTGLTPSDLTMQLFINNGLQPWLFVDGTLTADAQIVSGKVFFNEVPGSPGIYSLRFRPDSLGYWRLLVDYRQGNQIMAQDYDVTPNQPLVSSGIKSSFVKPCGT